MIKKPRVIGSQKLRSRLADIRRQAPGLIDDEDIKRLMLRRIRKRFLDEKDPDGKRWPELSPYTAEGPGILRKTEHLYRAIKVIRGSSVGILATATGAGFRIGVVSNPWINTFKKGSRVEDPAEYARFHHFGTENMPMRRFLGISEDDRKAVLRSVRRKLKRVVG